MGFSKGRVKKMLRIGSLTYFKQESINLIRKDLKKKVMNNDSTASFNMYCCFPYGGRYPRHQIHISLGMFKYFHACPNTFTENWQVGRNGQSAKAICFILPSLPNVSLNMNELVTSRRGRMHSSVRRRASFGKGKTHTLTDSGV